MTKVLFVCKANICRSPLAEMYLRHQIKVRRLDSDFFVDSAGVNCPGEGISSDPMVQEICKKYEIQSTTVLSRPINTQDLERFDYILAMDVNTVLALEELKNEESKAQIDLLMTYGPNKKLLDVPDPIARDYDYFEKVFGFIKLGVQGFLAEILSTSYNSNKSRLQSS